MYVVSVNDFCGEYDREECDTFAAALVLIERFRLQYPRKCVVVARPDSANLDFDGLTDEEHDQL